MRLRDLTEECTKKRFESKRHAREAHAKAHWRVRAYYCQGCRAWHATNAEKR